MKYGLLLLVGTLLFLLLDAMVLPILSKHVFQQYIGDLQKEQIDWIAAVITRILLAGGVLIFVTTSVAVQDLGDAFSMGLIFGLIVYGVYECTNQALLKARSRNLVLIDVAWGMLLCAVVSSVLWYLANYLHVIGQ